MTPSDAPLADASYSQFHEDREILAFFGRATHGVYLDVGANDGVTGSNSYLLERHGWTGILVEPNAALAEKCRAVRPRSIVIAKAAVGPESPKQVEFYEYAGSGPAGENFDGVSSVGRPSFLDDKVQRDGARVRKIVIPAATLDEIVAESGLTDAIDFLSLDIEGLEVAALRGFDFTKRQPRLIAIEDNSCGADRTVETLLKRVGYRRVHRTGVNDWYVRRADVGRFWWRRVVLRTKLAIWDFARWRQRLAPSPPGTPAGEGRGEGG